MARNLFWRFGKILLTVPVFPLVHFLCTMDSVMLIGGVTIFLTVNPSPGEKPYTCQWPECNNQFARWVGIVILRLRLFLIVLSPQV